MLFTLVEMVQGERALVWGANRHPRFPIGHVV